MFNFLKRRKNTSLNLISKKLMREFSMNRLGKGTGLLCHAPFKSMLFIQSGDAKVCHYNRGFSLGKYPDSSVHNLWFGKQQELIKEHIQKNDLSFGCHDCLRNLIKREFYAVGAARYDYLADYEQQLDYPVMMDFQLRNHCNLECFMCSGEYSSSIRANREMGKPLPEPWDNNFVEQLNEFIPHLKAASFTGGEPLLIDIYYDIWGKLLEANPDTDIFISTNASILPARFAELMSKLKFNFTISIDSIEKRTYEFIRKNAIFETTMENIGHLHKYCIENKRHFAVKCCIIKQNCMEFPEFFEYWNTRNIMLYPKLVAFPPYASMRNSSANEIKAIIDEYKKLKTEPASEIQKSNLQYYLSIINQLQVIYKQLLNEKKDDVIIRKNSEELKKIIFDNIEKHVIQNPISDTLPNKKRVEQYHTLLEQIFSEIKDEEELKKSLLFIIIFPLENLVSELNRNSLESLIIRFKQAAL